METAMAAVAGGPGTAEAADGERLIQVAHELVKDTGTWVSDKVCLKWMGADRGCGIETLAPIAAGEVMLRGAASAATVVSSELAYPWESQEFVSFCNAIEQEPDSGGEGSARLVVRLTNLLLRASADSDTALERYIAALPTTEASPSQWPPAARRLLRSSALGAQAEGEVDDLERKSAEMAAAWPGAAPPSGDFYEAYSRATMLVSTRAFATNTALGALLCPVLDFVNHCNKEDMNSGYAFDDGHFSLEAVADIPAGTEVLVCYDADADFLELWSRYGFFDATARIHTVEISVPSGAVAPDHVGGVFWIPAAAVPLECPLLESLVEVAAAEGGDEAEARRLALSRFAALIRQHLAGYAEEEGGAPEEDDPIRGYRHVVSGILRYEQRLLMGTLEKVEALVAGDAA